jgi:hypothetical protein
LGYNLPARKNKQQDRTSNTVVDAGIRKEDVMVHEVLFGLSERGGTGYEENFFLP